MLKPLFLVPFIVAFIQCAGTAHKADPDNYTVGKVKAEPDKYSFSNAYTIDLSKDSIFSKCMEFVSTKFFSTKDVLKLADKEKGKILCNATMDLCKGTDVSCYYGFDMIIEIKDNRYTISFTNFVSWKNGKDIKVENSELVNYIKSNVSIIETDLNNFMKNISND
jgi:hypothetical protein